VLTLGFEKRLTETCTAVTSLMTAPSCNLWAAPSEKETPRPEKKFAWVGAVMPDVTLNPSQQAGKKEEKNSIEGV